MKIFKDIFLLILILLFCNLFGCKEADREPMVSSRSQNYAPGELIVKFKSGTFDDKGNLASESVKLLNNKYGLISMEPIFKGRPASELSNIYKLKFSPDVDIMKLMQEYQEDPSVVYAEPNYIVHTMN